VNGVLPDLARAVDAIAARGGDLGRPLHLLDETSSTNDEAKRAARLGAPHGSTWVAESQTAGRGRQGRAWVSPRGENLLFSVLIRTSGPAMRLPLVSLVSGLAVAEAIERAAPSAAVRIKWPNDVVVVVGAGRPKKLAGILVETSMTGDSVDAIVVGVGINVHTRTFPEDIGQLATSVACLSATPPDRAEILADVLEGLGREVGVVLAMGLGPVHARLSKRDVLRGQRVRSERGEGIATGIDLEGRLLVEESDGPAVWNAGEVHLAPMTSQPKE
jgi:BirA family transcriptional regulator, biotin operon repressor / biotin---[acetyl-CoA-carboxylase] ligase